MRFFFHWTPIFLIALCQISPAYSSDVKSCLALLSPTEASFKELNYYERLGLSRDASADEIKKAYRKISMRYHPDRPSGGVEALFKLAKEAYETLGDTDKKLAYDKYTDFETPANSTTGTTTTSTTAGTTNPKPKTEREKFLEEFFGDIEKMSETNRTIARPILGIYGHYRKEVGPVQGFLKIMSDWYHKANGWERLDSIEIGNFLLKHFYQDFKANSPTTKDRYDLLVILKGRHTENQEVQQELIAAIADQSKSLTEAIQYSLFANTFYVGSGIRIRDLIKRFPQHYSINEVETAWLIVYFTVRMRTNFKYVDDFYKEVFTELRMIGSKESLEMILKLRDSYTWSNELTRGLESEVYNIGHNNPAALQALVDSSSPYAETAKQIYQAQDKKSRALKEMFRNFDPSTIYPPKKG